MCDDESRSQKEKQEDATLIALKMDNGAMRNRTQAAFQDGKGNEFSPGASRRNATLLIPVRHVFDF